MPHTYIHAKIPLKKFILTRFAIGVFDEDWLRHKMKVFETITLPSFENTGVDEYFYWLILIDTDMPQIPKEKFKQLISNSSINSNIYIIEVDYYSEFIDAIKDFIKKHCSKNEMIIQACFDSDDAVSIGFFKKLDEIIKDMNDIVPMLITFPNLYYFYPEEKRIIKKNYQFHSTNNFLVTNDREVTSYQVGHNKMGKWALSIGYKVLIINTKKPLFLYLVFPNSTHRTHLFLLNKNNYFEKMRLSKLFSPEMDIKTKCIKIKNEIFKIPKKIYNLSNFFNKPIIINEKYLTKTEETLENQFSQFDMNILPKEFNIAINKLDKYYEMYPTTPKIGIPICYISRISEKSRRLKTRLRLLNAKENLTLIEIEEKNRLEKELKILKQDFIKERLASSVIISTFE